MKNKRVRKTQKKYLDIPMDKSSKVILYALGIILILLILLITFTFLIPSFSKFFWFYIRNPINDFLFYLFENIPFITDHYLLIFISIIMLSGGIVTYINYVKIPKKRQKQMFVIANIFYKVLSLVICLALLQILITLSDYNHVNINTFYLNKYSDYSYNEDDVFNLLSELNDIILVEAKLQQRDNGEVKAKKNNLELIARKNLSNISKSYPFLKGRYPMKIKNINKRINAYGYTNNYAIATDKSINNINYLSVITHEYCHFKGILHESDAVYCSYLAGINSSDLLSRYSSHLEAFSWVMNVAEKIDEDKTNKIVEDVFNLCLNDNYREVCDLQIKNINKYQDNSNAIVIGSYVLDSYHDHVDEFIDILDIYLNKYDALFYIDGNAVSLMDIRNSIVSDENKTLEIVLKNDVDSFNKVSKFLKSSNRYFKSIRQQNTNYRIDDEDVNYYLEPFSKSGLPQVFENESYTDYAYARIVRLLLEHRSVYGIK